MKRMLFVVALVALAVPFAALAADPSGTEGSSPAQACRAEQVSMATDAFKAMYGTNADKSNAFGKCVAKKATGREKSHANAVSACRTEQADTAFADNHGGKTFDQFYGTGKNGSGAFGKCVSSKAKASNDTADATVLDAVKQCRSGPRRRPGRIQGEVRQEPEPRQRVRQVRLADREGERAAAGNPVGIVGEARGRGAGGRPVAVAGPVGRGQGPDVSTLPNDARGFERMYCRGRGARWPRSAGCGSTSGQRS